MSELSFLVLPKHRDELISFVEDNYSRTGLLPLSREEFLGEFWRAISNFVRINSQNLFLRHALSIYPNLIHRAFVILSVWFATRDNPPTLHNSLLELIEMLQHNLNVIEQNVTRSGMSNVHAQYFSGVCKMWNVVCSIYEQSNIFDSDILPSTAHHAFVLIANRNPKLFFQQNIEPELIFGHIHVLMKKYKNYYPAQESQAA